MSRRVASNYLITENKCLTNHVVVIEGEKVVDYYPLEGEPPMTEWLGGTIEITDGKAYFKRGETRVLLRSN